ITEYKLKYMNNSDTKVRCDIEVGMYLVDEGNPDDLKKRMKGDADNVQFQLDPGDTKRIQGRLSKSIAGVNDDELEPQLIYHPNQGAIISCEPVSDTLTHNSFRSGR